MKPILYFWLLAVSLSARAQSSEPAVYVASDGVRISYNQIGTGKPVLLIHGFIVDSSMWRDSPLIQALNAAGYRVILPDLRGNGRSEKPHTREAYQNDQEVKDLIGLMKQLGYARYDVVGYSRGAILAARLLVLDPQVQKAVLGGMSADFTDPNWYRRRNFHEALARPGSHPELQGAIDYAKRIGADTLALMRMQESQPTASRAELAAVRRPVLVINGDQDRDNGDPQTLADAIPGARLVIVPGNHGNTARSEAFAREAVQWLKQ